MFRPLYTAIFRSSTVSYVEDTLFLHGLGRVGGVRSHFTIYVVIMGQIYYFDTHNEDDPFEKKMGPVDIHSLLKSFGLWLYVRLFLSMCVSGAPY
jgi:hypothetical protein